MKSQDFRHWLMSLVVASLFIAGLPSFGFFEVITYYNIDLLSLSGYVTAAGFTLLSVVIHLLWNLRARVTEGRTALHLAGRVTTKPHATKEIHDEDLGSAQEVRRGDQLAYLRDIFSSGHTRLSFKTIAQLFTSPMDLVSMSSKEVDRVASVAVVFSLSFGLLPTLYPAHEYVGYFFQGCSIVVAATLLYFFVLAIDIVPKDYPPSGEMGMCVLVAVAYVEALFGKYMVAEIFYGLIVGMMIGAITHFLPEHRGVKGMTSTGIYIILTCIGPLDTFAYSSRISSENVRLVFLVGLSLSATSLSIAYSLGFNPKLRSGLWSVTVFMLAVFVGPETIGATCRAIGLPGLATTILGFSAGYAGMIHGSLYKAWRNNKEDILPARVREKASLQYNMLPLCVPIFFQLAYFIQATTGSASARNAFIAVFLSAIPALWVFDVPRFTVAAGLIRAQVIAARVSGRESIEVWVDALSRWQGLWWSLPAASSGLMCISDDTEVTSFFVKLRQYAQRSMEAATTVRVLHYVAATRQKPLSALYYALWHGFLQELTLVGMEDRLVRQSVRVLVVLKILDSDPYREKRALVIRSKGHTYAIENTDEATVESMIGVLVTSLSREQSSDANQLLSIVRIVDCLSRASNALDVRPALELLIEVAEEPHGLIDTALIAARQKVEDELADLIRELEVLKSKRVTGNQRRLIESWLQWFRLHTEVSNRTVRGILLRSIIEQVRLLAS